MAMTALYPNYDMSSLSSSSSSQTMSHHHHHHLHNHHHPHHHSHHQQHQQQQQQHHHHQQQQQQHHHHAPAMQQTNRSASLLAAAAHQQQQQQSQQSPQTQQQQQQSQQQSHQQQQQPQKDYSIPLHVDCSVEYELPNQAKPPVGGRVEPLLMIHPCYFRKMESQRRSPFINNMPNNSSSASTARGSSSVAAVAAAASSRRSNLIGAAPSQPAAHLLSQNAPNVIQQQQLQQQSQQQTQQQHQKLQQQLDEYVQRQMAHISQQAQFPSIAQQQQQQQQSASQYGAATGSGNWDRYLSAMPNASSMLQGKVNIPNQSAYKKSGKRHLAATCANNAYAASHLEGALPNGIARWDEKTAMATIPRDYAPEHAKCSSAVASTAGRALYCGQQQQQPQIQGGAQLMSGAKRDRDPMLSGGCIYSNNNNNNNSNNSNNNNNNNNNNNSSSGNSSGNSNNNNNNGDMNGLVSTAVGLPWPIQKSPMAAIPNSNYHQAGPDSIPNNSSSNHHSSSNSTNSSNATTTTTTAASKSRQSSGQTVIHHSHYAAQQPHQLSDKVINSNNNNNSSVITVKCRQYRNSHRMHPYMMNMSAPAVNNGVSLAGAGLTYFPQLNANPFAQIQQVSCYNV